MRGNTMRTNKARLISLIGLAAFLTFRLLNISLSSHPVCHSNETVIPTSAISRGQGDLLMESLDLENATFMGVNAKEFGNVEQKIFYRLLRKLYKDKMYPLDVKPNDRGHSFHQHPNFGAKRGRPVGRYYMHNWMRNFTIYAEKYLPLKGVKCLEIGDGHFLFADRPDAWGDITHKFFPFCDVTKSLSVDLSDRRAKAHLNLESPFETLKEKNFEQTLKEGFNFVICAQVFEHIDKPWDAIKGLGDLVQPGGIILFSVPFNGNLIHGHDVHRFTVTGVRNLAEHGGFSVVESLTLGNSLTTTGANLDLSAEDFTREELYAEDGFNYVGVYSILMKT